MIKHVLLQWYKFYSYSIGLYEWLDTLSRYGVAIIKNAPLTDDQVQRLCDRVSFIRQTYYGKEYIVRAEPGATNFAYTSHALQFHSDLPYYDYMPGVTLLHCIQQTKSPGAFNLLADGFYVAEKLRQTNPKAFECLTKTMVNWSDYVDSPNKKYETIFRNPVIWYGSFHEKHKINQNLKITKNQFFRQIFSFL